MKKRLIDYIQAIATELLQVAIGICVYLASAAVALAACVSGIGVFMLMKLVWTHIEVNRRDNYVAYVVDLAILAALLIALMHYLLQ